MAETWTVRRLRKVTHKSLTRERSKSMQSVGGRAEIQSRITDQTQDFAGCICKESFALIEIIRAI